MGPRHPGDVSRIIDTIQLLRTELLSQRSDDVRTTSNRSSTSRVGVCRKTFKQKRDFMTRSIFQPSVTILLYAMLRYFILLLSLHAKQNIYNLEFLEEISDSKTLSSIAVMNFWVGHQTLLPFVVLIFQELPTLYPSFWDFLSSNRTIEGFHGFCGGSSATLPTARSHPAREGVFSCHTTHRHRVMRIKKIRQRLG